MRLRSLPGLIFLAIAVLLLLPSAVGYYTDWLWFKEVGYQSVYLRTLNAQGLVFASVFGAVFVFLYVNLHIATRSLTRPRVVLGTGVDGRPIALEGRSLSGLARWLSVGLALLIGWAAASDWLTWLSFFHGAPFNQADPLFGHDISFYVFRLPIWQTLRQQALTTTFLALIGCGLYYVLSGSFVIESKFGSGFWPRMRLIPSARRHLSILTAMIFGLMAWGAWLERPMTLLSQTGTVFGASYADVHARIPFIWITFGVLVLGVVLSIVHGIGRRTWPIVTAVALYIGVSLIGGVYAGIVQRFFVTPNELDAEQPYIANNIAATRQAYALDDVDERELTGDATLDPRDIANNVPTIDNVRLWDHEPLLRTFGQIQEIRTYYAFKSVDNDRYTIDGKLRQVMLSARELNTELMPTRTWINEHLTYTHGYGLTLGPVNQVTTEGLPVLFLQNIPPVTTKPELKIDRPAIYFGELPSGYAIVRTKRDEFDYPRSSDDYATTRYSGSGGVPIGTFLRRLLFAIQFKTSEILFTDQTTADSRILYYRSIRERLTTLAPFLQYDNDPYPVVSGGRLYWMQDAYTMTNNYPYAQRVQTARFGTINYIRNSVKIVIDAYDGTTTFYLAEPEDPLAATLAGIFPGLLQPMSAMPPDLRSHVRYPEDIFAIQAALYTTYHMTLPNVFYSKEDQWQLPTIDTGQNAKEMQPYYTVMRLPGEKQTEFIQMLPFTPRGRNNLAAWLAARSDAEHYGRLIVYQFPKEKVINGPLQIAGRISQDPQISSRITLWNQQGSQVLWGTLLVIPVEESLLYVRPLYLQASSGKMPELKNVVVAYQSQIVMAETLKQALIQIFGASLATALPADRMQSSATSIVPSAADVTVDQPPTPTPTAEATQQEMIVEAQQHMERADRAMRNGDLATYAEEMKKAKELIDKAVRSRK
jgi:uncharacterized membrane protein (UPF0182 family)